MLKLAEFKESSPGRASYLRISDKGALFSRIAAVKMAGVHDPEKLCDRLRKYVWSTVLVVFALGLGGCAISPTYPEVKDFKTVVVDPGHGGHDSGAITRGRKPRIFEKDMALDISHRVASKLRSGGLNVVMTRRDDRFITLDQRVRISNAHEESVFVSIHLNHARRRGAHGVEVYHNNKGTARFAGRVARAVAVLPKSENRGVKTARFRVLRFSRGPALLVECGFLSNPAEASRFASPAYREMVASAIARAILEQRGPSAASDP